MLAPGRMPCGRGGPGGYRRDIARNRMSRGRLARCRPAPPSLLVFTAPERDLLRRALCMQFSQYPSAADGILLRTWRGGPAAGQPKLPPAIRTMLDRGLVELQIEGRWRRA